MFGDLEQLIDLLASRVTWEELLPQVSLDPQQDLGPCLKKLVVPLLLGPVTQVLWTTAEICPDSKLPWRVLLRVPCPQRRAGVSAGFFKEIPGSEKHFDVNCQRGQHVGSNCLEFEFRRRGNFF